MRSSTSRNGAQQRLSLVLVSLIVFAVLLGTSGFAVASASSQPSLMSRKLARLHRQPTPLISSSYISSTNWPVLFVHGFSDTSAQDCSSYWGTAENYLRGTHPYGSSSLHWTGALTAVSYYNGDTNCAGSLQSESGYCTNYYAGNNGTNNEDIRHIACELAWYIWNHYTQYGQNVQVVAHSMGGLITRWALYATPVDINLPPYIGVQDVVTLDTPHGGIPAGSSFFYCGNCVQFQQMGTNSTFMNDTYTYAQNPQGAGWGTDWTMEGSFGSTFGIPCSVVNYQYHSSTYMNKGHKLGYYVPCYAHGDFLTDTSDASDAVADRCDGCAISPSNWTRQYNALHALHEMLYGLYSSAS